MSQARFEGEFIKDKSDSTWIRGAEEFVDCVFENCDFSEGDIRDIQFEDCVFRDCNLSSCIVERTGFKQVEFHNCKILGLRFDTVNTFLLEMEFESCNLSMSVFVGMPLKNTRFVNCIIHDADFAEAQLESAVFTGTDLKGTQFDACNLSSADFRDSFNFHINPETNRISKARFSRNSIEGLLASFDILIE